MLFEAIRRPGGEGIVSKRRGSFYRGSESRDWLKTKCHQTGTFVITGFSVLASGRLEAVYVDCATARPAARASSRCGPS